MTEAAPFSLTEAFVSVYQQLRAVARARLANNRSAATLQATAVVHEALLRLLRLPPGSIVDEQHLVAIASQAIRHVIVDHARAGRALRRGGGRGPAPESERELDAVVSQVADPGRLDLLLDLDAAMGELSDVDDELRSIVELHCFGGLGHAEVAALLQLSERTVRRRWQFAAAQLRGRLAAWEGAGSLGDA